VSVPDSFNPLGYAALSDSLSRALMRSPLLSMGRAAEEPFHGYGVYALFYDGDFPAYRRLADWNRTHPGSWPIYIGVAAPKTLKGLAYDPEDVDSDRVERKLYERVRHHARSIGRASNLDLSDFSCRLLVLSSVWAPVAESAMIAAYEPLWNAYVPGFGNHAQGSGRSAGLQTVWDTLHPGRRMVGRPNPKTVSEIEAEVRQALEETWQRRFRE
jgi:hypothetical protein